jgi:hypothetical protein
LSTHFSKGSVREKFAALEGEALMTEDQLKAGDRGQPKYSAEAARQRHVIAQMQEMWLESDQLRPQHKLLEIGHESREEKTRVLSDFLRELAVTIAGASAFAIWTGNVGNGDVAVASGS